MHLLEALGDEPERLAEALVERRLQLLVDGRAHLLELLGVVGAQHVEALLDGRAHGLEALVGAASSALASACCVPCWNCASRSPSSRRAIAAASAGRGARR